MAISRGSAYLLEGRSFCSLDTLPVAARRLYIRGWWVGIVGLWLTEEVNIVARMLVRATLVYGKAPDAGGGGREVDLLKSRAVDLQRNSRTKPLKSSR
jgi:hypothetical protein